MASQKKDKKPKKDQKKKPQQNRSKLYTQTRQDVNRAYRPTLKGLGKEKEAAWEATQRDRARVGNIYDNLADTFAPLNRQFKNTSEQILSSATGALQGLGGAGMEGGLQELLGAMGGNYAAMLGTGMQGTLGNIAGLQAGALATRADIESNVMSQYRDFVNDLSIQRTEVKGQRAQAFLEELNRRREMRLAKREQQLRAEQFDKEFGLRKNQANKADQTERQGQRTVARHLRDEEADKQAKGVIKRTTPKIEALRSDIAALESQLAGIDPWAGEARAAVEARISRKEKELARLRGKRKKAKKERRD
jgi:hypothetical protein